MIDCFGRASTWVALPFALWLGHGWGESAVAWLALSGGAVLLERLVPAASPAP